MNDLSTERPAPGVCWTFHPSAIPSEFWSVFDGEISASPYSVPPWGLFWERVYPNAASDVAIVGIPDDGLVAMCITRRRRGVGEWMFCQPNGTNGLFATRRLDHQDIQLLRDAVERLAGKRCLQVTINGHLSGLELNGWMLTTNRYDSWILDASNSTIDTFLDGISENHRRNLERGSKAKAAYGAIKSPADVDRLQSYMNSTRLEDSRIVLDPRIGPLFVETFGESRAFRWFAAWPEDYCAATSLWLIRGNHAVYVDGATDRRANSTGLGHALFAHALTDLYQSGIRFFDLGSGPGGRSSDGLVRFKEGWGARAVSREELVFRRPFYHRIRRFV